MKIIKKIISKFKGISDEDKKLEKGKSHKGRPEKKHPKHFDNHPHDDGEDNDKDCDDAIY